MLEAGERGRGRQAVCPGTGRRSAGARDTRKKRAVGGREKGIEDAQKEGVCVCAPEE